MRKVEVVPYNEDWVDLFAQEAQILRDIFGDEIVDIHHIGSTSVPGLPAKPIIDILPVVRNILLVDEQNAAMIASGYTPKGENGICGRRYFQKGGERRSHHVHVYQVGSPDIERHLAFRDYLRAYPTVVQQYGQLKLSLAKQYPFAIDSYIQGKHQLVLEIERAALNWLRGQG